MRVAELCESIRTGVPLTPRRRLQHSQHRKSADRGGEHHSYLPVTQPVRTAEGHIE